MNYTYFIPIIMLFVILYITNRNQMMITKLIMKKRRKESQEEMLELAKRFIEKECIIYTFNGTQLTGTIKEVIDGAILIENANAQEAINLEFVLRIREYPKKKNGKKKSVVID